MLGTDSLVRFGRGTPFATKGCIAREFSKDFKASVLRTTRVTGAASGPDSVCYFDFQPVAAGQNIARLAFRIRG